MPGKILQQDRPVKLSWRPKPGESISGKVGEFGIINSCDKFLIRIATAENTLSVWMPEKMYDVYYHKMNSPNFVRITRTGRNEFIIVEIQEAEVVKKPAPLDGLFTF